MMILLGADVNRASPVYTRFIETLVPYELATNLT